MRSALRLACRQYSERVEMEIIRVREQVVNAGLTAAEKEKAELVGAGHAARGGGARAQSKAAAALAQVHDLRDMLTLLRTMQIKPQEGRRKDLKKIETVINDLALLTAHWD